MVHPDLVLVGATLVDGTGSPPQRDVSVLVRDGRIAQVAAAGQGRPAVVPGPDAVVLDLTGTTLLPGLVDVHVHVTTIPGRTPFDLVTEHPTARVLRAVPVLRAMLHAGVTTVRDLSGAAEAMRASVHEGVVEGPDLQLALRILSVTGGHGDWRSLTGVDLTGGSGGGAVADGPQEFVRAVREVAREGGHWVKVAASGGVGSPRSDPDQGGLSPAELTAVVLEAQRQGLVGVAAHAQGTGSIRDAVRAGVRSIEHGYAADAATIREMADRGTWLVPTLTTLLRSVPDDPQRPWVGRRRRDWQACARDLVGAAVAAGVPLAPGTDAGVVPHGQVLAEVQHLVRLGLDPVDALVAATSSAARLLGLQDEIGTVAVGHRADLVAVEGDLVADLAADRLGADPVGGGVATDPVRLVVARGRVVVDRLPRGAARAAGSAPAAGPASAAGPAPASAPARPDGSS